jgi:hypothetical protein
MAEMEYKLVDGILVYSSTIAINPIDPGLLHNLE